MDFDLPSRETMDKMNDEYARILSTKSVSVQSANDAESIAIEPDLCARCILFLYIGLLLGYNGVYGTEIYDAHRSVGGVRCAPSTFGGINNLCTNKR